MGRTIGRFLDHGAGMLSKGIVRPQPLVLSLFFFLAMRRAVEVCCVPQSHCAASPQTADSEPAHHGMKLSFKSKGTYFPLELVTGDTCCGHKTD